MRLPARVVGETYTSTAGWRVLEDLVGVGNRMAGQDGEAEGAAVIEEAFHEHGFRDPGVEEFDIPGWWRESSSIVLNATEVSADHHVIALPGTPAASVSACVVDVGTGSLAEIDAADIDGQIALASTASPPGSARSIHRMEKYAAAAETGAIGFVFQHTEPGCLPPTGEIGYHNRPGPLPAVGVSREVGARLARHDDEVTLEVACRNAPAVSRNVEATLGPETDREVLVTAHVDAHDISEGARDNGAGCALVVEVGRALAAVEDDLGLGVRLVTFGSEEIGLYGAYHWSETRDLDRVQGVVNIDAAGDSRDLLVKHSGYSGFEDAFRTVTTSLGHPLEASPTVSPHGDEWPFVQEGVPAMMASSASATTGRGWGHTHADTLDKLDVRDLRDLSVVIAGAVLELTNGGARVARRSREAVRAELDEGQLLELRESGRWPYE